MAKAILTDTSFWIALFRPDDDYHDRAGELLEQLRSTSILVPWPIFYEVLSTRFIRNKNWVEQFERIMRRPEIKKINDEQYRNQALDETLRLAAQGKRNISLVDMVVRSILSDKTKTIDCIFTSNDKDFIDVCKKRNININYDESL